jgi:hypothetical protein
MTLVSAERHRAKPSLLAKTTIIFNSIAKMAAEDLTARQRWQRRIDNLLAKVSFLSIFSENLPLFFTIAWYNGVRSNIVLMFNLLRVIIWE